MKYYVAFLMFIFRRREVILKCNRGEKRGGRMQKGQRPGGNRAKIAIESFSDVGCRTPYIGSFRPKDHGKETERPFVAVAAYMYILGPNVY